MSLSLKNKNILIVVAHPDDELLGLGATMHKLIKEENVKTKVLILGEGITSRSNKRSVGKWKKELATHQRNLKKAQKAIGYHSIKTFKFPDNRFDTVALLEIIKVIEKEKRFFRPDILFTHHGGDVNIDHQRTFEAVITACRPIQGETVNTIITFETPSSTEWRASSDPRQFIPNLFIEVTQEDLIAKTTGMECYEYEKRSYPHPRSTEALIINAQRWGVVIGKEYAEAFQIIRLIN